MNTPLNLYNNTNAEVFEIQLHLLLEAIYLRYGYDFRNYSKAHLKRRILHYLSVNQLDSVIQLIDKILDDTSVFSTLLDVLSINVTEMFRDPLFFKSLKERIFPNLATYAYFKVWIAGCSTGEEVYSLAILLHEAGLLNRCQIYATDFNRKVLSIAHEGVYQKSDIDHYLNNYVAAGGKDRLSNYYQARYGSVIFDKFLIERVVFADHNLVTDSVFAEVNLILCRNVMIYFNKTLQDKTLQLFNESLNPNGFLCLGTKESLKFSRFDKAYEVIDDQNKIYKKISN